jgi:Ca2+/Na+ antiporter
MDGKANKLSPQSCIFSFSGYTWVSHLLFPSPLQMPIDLPLSQTIIEILLVVFITLYGLAGLGTFSAYIPKINNSDDEFIKGNLRDYLFWLLTSIIFFLYAIFFSHNRWVSVLLVVELVALITAFVRLVYKKKRYIIDRVKMIALKRKFF